MNMNQSGTYYRVEARTTDGEPAKVGEQVIAGKWVNIDFYKSPIGVKVKGHQELPASYGYFNYTAAKALQMWVVNDLGITNVETRIKSFTFKMSCTFDDGPCEGPINWSHVNFKKEELSNEQA